MDVESHNDVSDTKKRKMADIDNYAENDDSDKMFSSILHVEARPVLG